MLSCGWWQKGESSVWSRCHAGPPHAGQEGQSITPHSGPAVVQTKDLPPSTQRISCRIAFAKYLGNIPCAGSHLRTALSPARA